MRFKMFTQVYETVNEWLNTVDINRVRIGKIQIKEWYESKYQIEEVLGMGHSSVVFKAIDTRLDRLIALKVWHSREQRIDSSIILRECKHLAKSEHLRIVKVFDFGINAKSGRPWAALEYLGSKTLRIALKENQKWFKNWSNPIKVAIQLASIVDYLHHSMGLFQLDLKPENISSNPIDNTIKLMDLGSAKNTDYGFRMGTPGYIAPELLKRGAITAKCDIFSLGVIIYEMIVGENPLLDLQADYTSTVTATRSPTAAISPRLAKSNFVYNKMKSFNPNIRLLRLNIPKSLIELINEMCCFDPEFRPTAHTARISLKKLIESSNETQLPSLFISHSHLDKSRFVTEFAKNLKQRGFSIWLDEWNLKTGEPFWEKIGTAIKACDFVIVILSENSIHSLGVLEEIRTAQLFNLERVKILPIRIDPIDFSSIPVQLRSRQVLDFVGWENKKKFDEIISKLTSDIMALSEERVSEDIS